MYDRKEQLLPIQTFIYPQREIHSEGISWGKKNNFVQI